MCVLANPEEPFSPELPTGREAFELYAKGLLRHWYTVQENYLVPLNEDDLAQTEKKYVSEDSLEWLKVHHGDVNLFRTINEDSGERLLEFDTRFSDVVESTILPDGYEGLLRKAIKQLLKNLPGLGAVQVTDQDIDDFVTLFTPKELKNVVAAVLLGDIDIPEYEHQSKQVFVNFKHDALMVVGGFNQALLEVLGGQEKSRFYQNYHIDSLSTQVPSFNENEAFFSFPAVPISENLREKAKQMAVEENKSEEECYLILEQLALSREKNWFKVSNIGQAEVLSQLLLTDEKYTLLLKQYIAVSMRHVLAHRMDVLIELMRYAEEMKRERYSEVAKQLNKELQNHFYSLLVEEVKKRNVHLKRYSFFVAGEKPHVTVGTLDLDTTFSWDIVNKKVILSGGNEEGIPLRFNEKKQEIQFLLQREEKGTFWSKLKTIMWPIFGVFSAMKVVSPESVGTWYRFIPDVEKLHRELLATTDMQVFLNLLNKSTFAGLRESVLPYEGPGKIEAWYHFVLDPEKTMQKEATPEEYLGLEQYDSTSGIDFDTPDDDIVADN